MNRAFFLGLLFLIAGCSRTEHSVPAVPVPRGTDVGNAGDVLAQYNSGAWFLTTVTNERAIRTCLKITDNFGVNEAAARAVIEEGLEAWRQYLIAQQIELTIDTTHYRPATKLEWVKCDEQPSLVFLLGVDDPSVMADKARFLNPMAFAQRTTEGAAGWGNGYIWISPPGKHAPDFPRWGTGKQIGRDRLEDEAQLRQVVLHEWGHVLGCDHVAGTIMRADIVEHLSADASGEKYASRFREAQLRRNLTLAQIDQELQLLHPRICYKKEDSGECLNAVERGVADAGSEEWPSEYVRKLLFRERSLQSIHYELELRTMPDKSQRYRIFYRGFSETGSNPVEARLEIEAPEAPLFDDDVTQVFKMKWADQTQSYRAAGNEVHTGRFRLGDDTFTALIQKTTRAAAPTKIWLLKDGIRHPIVF